MSFSCIVTVLFHLSLKLQSSCLLQTNWLLSSSKKAYLNLYTTSSRLKLSKILFHWRLHFTFNVSPSRFWTIFLFLQCFRWTCPAHPNCATICLWNRPKSSSHAGNTALDDYSQFFRSLYAKEPTHVQLKCTSFGRALQGVQRIQTSPVKKLDYHRFTLGHSWLVTTWGQ